MLNITIKEIKSKLQWGITSHWSELLLFSHSVMSDSCNPMDCSTPGFPVLHYPQSLLKLMSIESVMPSNHLILCHPLLLLPSISPSIKVFSNELALCIRCQSIGASAPASVLPMNVQGWFPLGLTGLIFLLSKGLSRVFSSTTVQNHQFFDTQISFWSNSPIHNDHWQNHSFD